MSPRLIACTAAWLLVSNGGRAQAPAPPDAACRSALAALDAAEAASRPALATLQAARQRAARACLGGPPAASAPQASRDAPPVVVAPVVVPQRPASTTPLPAPPPLALPRPAAAPLWITTCDAHGCWASDSSYWHRAGGELIGPRGRCRAAGVQLVCP